MALGTILAISRKLRHGIVELRRSAMLIVRSLSNRRRGRLRRILQRASKKARGRGASKRNPRKELMKDILLIDDVRVMPATRVARTYDEGIAQIKEKQPDLLLLDHDLGHTEPEKTGYGIVCFLEENNIKPKEIKLVTANPVGAMKMEAALESMGYKYDQMLRTWYIR